MIHRALTLRVGRVAHYRTHQDHEDSEGNVFPKGSLCLATRSASGELVLLFLTFRENGDAARAVWLPEGFGLCGVEPNVLDPMKANMGMVNEVIAQIDARMAREIREEREQRARERKDFEDGIQADLDARVEADLDREMVPDQSEVDVVSEDDGEV